MKDGTGYGPEASEAVVNRWIDRATEEWERASGTIRVLRDEPFVAYGLTWAHDEFFGRWEAQEVDVVIGEFRYGDGYFMDRRVRDGILRRQYLWPVDDNDCANSDDLEAVF